MSVAGDIMAHAVSLLEGYSVDRAIAAGTFTATNILDSHASLAAVGAPYPVIIEPGSLAWEFPADYTTVAVTERWDTVAFRVDVYVTPHMVDPNETSSEIASIAYEIRRTLSDPSSWTSITGFVTVSLGGSAVDTVETDFSNTDDTDFIYVFRQPMVVTYREDHT